MSVLISLFFMQGSLAMSDGSVSNFVQNIGGVVNIPEITVPVAQYCDVPVTLVNNISYGLDMEGRHVFYVKDNGNTKEIWYYDLGLDTIGGTKDDGGEKLIRNNIRLPDPGEEKTYLSISSVYGKPGEYEAVYILHSSNQNFYSSMRLIKSGPDGVFGTADDTDSMVYNIPYSSFDVFSSPPYVNDGVLVLGLIDFNGFSYYSCNTLLSSGVGSCGQTTLNKLALKGVNALNIFVKKVGNTDSIFYTVPGTVVGSFSIFSEVSKSVSPLFDNTDVTYTKHYLLQDNAGSFYFFITGEGFVPSTYDLKVGLLNTNYVFDVASNRPLYSDSNSFFDLHSVSFKGSVSTIKGSNDYLFSWNEGLKNGSKKIMVKAYSSGWQESIRGTTEPYIVGVDGNSVVFYDRTSSGTSLKSTKCV